MNLLRQESSLLTFSSFPAGLGPHQKLCTWSCNPTAWWPGFSTVLWRNVLRFPSQPNKRLLKPKCLPPSNKGLHHQRNQTVM